MQLPQAEKMNKFVVDGDTAVLHSLFAEDKFRIVEKVPANFVVWNIGSNMVTNEYIPFCIIQPSREWLIDRNQLYAIRLPENEVKLLRKAASWGIGNLKEARFSLKSRKEERAELARQVIGIFERITE